MDFLFYGNQRFLLQHRGMLVMHGTETHFKSHMKTTGNNHISVGHIYGSVGNRRGLTILSCVAFVIELILRVLVGNL